MLRLLKLAYKNTYYVKVAFAVIFVIYCLLNIYDSSRLSDAFNNPHINVPDVSYTRSLEGHAKTGSAVKVDADYESDMERLSSWDGISEVDYPAYNVTVASGELRYVPLWQRRLRRRIERHNSSLHGDDFDDGGPYYFLTELLQVRIYDGDKARWSLRELKQWMHYMLLAGVDHFYICDHFEKDSEKLDRVLRRYIDSGLVTYIAWNSISRNALWAQTRCYQQLVRRYRTRHRWQIAVDMDEYPFALNDIRENFLVRYLHHLHHDVSEVSLPNYLMLGEGDRSRSRIVVDRILRMTPTAANALVKPVYQPRHVRWVKVHHNFLQSGNRVDADPEQLRMLHYWGARGFESDEDRDQSLAKTVEMTAMRDAWTRQIENSLIVFGEVDVFSNVTGP